MPIDLVVRIASAKDSDSRFSLIEELETEWRSPLTAKDGYSDSEIEAASRKLGIRFPATLRNFYRHFGRRFVKNCQDNLVELTDLSIREDKLVIYSENQGVCWWTIRCADLASDDPPVFYERDDECVQENPELSEFLLQSAISEYKWFDESVWGGEISPEALERLKGEAKRLPFPDSHWPIYPTSLWQCGNVLIQISVESPNDSAEAFAGSKDPDDLSAFVDRFSDIAWE